MGTAVLLPEDCLPLSKGRHKNNFSDVLYGSDSTPRARRSTFQVLDPCSFYADPSRPMFIPNRGVKWSATCGTLPLPEHGPTPLHTSLLQKEADRKKMKARRPMEPRHTELAAKSGSDAPIFTILQRPKDKAVAEKLITEFLVKVDQVQAPNGVPDMHLNLKVDECIFSNGQKNAILGLKKGGSKLKKGAFDRDLEVEGPKFQDLKLNVPKLQDLVLSKKVESSTLKNSKTDRGKYQTASKSFNVAKRNGYSRFVDLEPQKGLNQLSALKVAEEHKSAGAAENLRCKPAYANHPTRVDRIVMGGLTQLRHASSDPQMVKHLVGQYRSEVMEIPCGEAKPCHGFTRTTSMSCPERWSGPAYSSSPAPSSLPLPKFSLPNQKMALLDLSPLSVERHNRNTTQPLELGSIPLLPGSPLGRELDVASATKSLRRMLKLDPF